MAKRSVAVISQDILTHWLTMLIHDRDALDLFAQPQSAKKPRLDKDMWHSLVLFSMA
ncbi:MAG: hypothetical protein AAF664_05040 [Planctomycetota bacterium]